MRELRYPTDLRWRRPNKELKNAENDIARNIIDSVGSSREEYPHGCEKLFTMDERPPRALMNHAPITL